MAKNTQIGVLWERTSKGGVVYFSGFLYGIDKDIPIFIYPQKTENENAPSHFILREKTLQTKNGDNSVDSENENFPF